jgi:hypothetical protein
MVAKYTNNASTVLASGINSSVTSLTVSSGKGALFPTISSSLDYFYCTLANSAGNVEIVQVTARSTDTFTIVRGQDGTTAQSWNTNDIVELRITAAEMNNLTAGIIQGGGTDHVFIQNGTTVNNNYTIPTGTNAISIGPITVASGVAVTVASGSRWLVL